MLIGEVKYMNFFDFEAITIYNRKKSYNACF